jgi:hypothetical protein
MERQIEKAKEVKAKYLDEWLVNAQIVSIGIGFVEEGVIGIAIGAKGQIESLREKIPDMIEGVPIHINKVKKLRAQK